jgi:SagB-type dehydrogenase family enzyme
VPGPSRAGREPATPVLDYHQSTKHSFHRFARSLGYLDWDAQPDPFRRYRGAPLVELPRQILRGDIPYHALFDRSAPPAPIDQASIGEFLRCSMGLSAWKQHQASRWALRVNPSSGNLHPTDAYIVWDGRVCHYAPREHALEVRAELGRAPGALPTSEVFLVGLTSILWREAWKYGERAFRYCQHDVGHAIGALRVAAALLGWTLTLLPDWSDEQIATMLGLDRDADFGDAEREEAECLAVVTPNDAAPALDAGTLVDAARRATWSGQANVLSGSHVRWDAIDEVARATRKGTEGAGGGKEGAVVVQDGVTHDHDGHRDSSPRAREVILRRRSAVAFDAKSSLSRNTFISMLQRLDPDRVPFDAIDWPPHVHLILFVHRVDDLPQGLYAWVRDPAAFDELRAAMRPDFLWERVSASDGSNASNLFLLVPTDVRFAGNRLSCDQEIAGDGFFSLGMLARLEPALQEYGNWFYRRLFWECGLIGQLLYLEAEAAGARSTGIGCFYDDPVHEVLGLSGMTWQTLYHFSMGIPVDDTRLTTETGYPEAF